MMCIIWVIVKQERKSVAVSVLLLKTPLSRKLILAWKQRLRPPSLKRIYFPQLKFVFNRAETWHRISVKGVLWNFKNHHLKSLALTKSSRIGLSSVVKSNLKRLLRILNIQILLFDVASPLCSPVPLLYTTKYFYSLLSVSYSNSIDLQYLHAANWQES